MRLYGIGGWYGFGFLEKCTVVVSWWILQLQLQSVVNRLHIVTVF